MVGVSVFTLYDFEWSSIASASSSGFNRLASVWVVMLVRLWVPCWNGGMQCMRESVKVRAGT